MLHSGIYYQSGTLKAEVCMQGAMEMKEFHRPHNLRLGECGKLSVFADRQDAPQLDMLAERALQHDIPIEELDEQQLREMESEARFATGCAI